MPICYSVVQHQHLRHRRNGRNDGLHLEPVGLHSSPTQTSRHGFDNDHGSQSQRPFGDGSDYPGWRQLTEEPKYLVVDQTSVQLGLQTP